MSSKLKHKISLKDCSTTLLIKDKVFSAAKKLDTVSKHFYFTQRSLRHVDGEVNEGLDQERMTKEMLEGAQESVSKQRSKKKRLLSFIFLMINLAVLAGVLIYQFAQEDMDPFSPEVFAQINWWWILLGLVAFMVINFLDSARMFVFIKAATGRNRPWLSYKSIVTTRFYDNITPLAIGGQPFQVFYLNKRGISASSATSAPIARYVYGQTIFLIFAVIMLIVGHTFLEGVNPLAMTACYIGLGLNLLLIGSVMFLSSSKKVAPAIAKGLLKLLNKMHIIKDYNKTFQKVMKTVNEYIVTTRKFMSNGWILVIQIFLSIAYLLLIYTLPFLVYLAFGGTDSSLWFEMVVLAMICDLAVSFIPLPGGAGAAELSFKALFIGFFSPNVFVWAMIFWRFLAYYGYLLQGALLLFYDFIIGNKKIEPLLQRFKEEDRMAMLNNPQEAHKGENTVKKSTNKDNSNTSGLDTAGSSRKKKSPTSANNAGVKTAPVNSRKPATKKSTKIKLIDIEKYNK